MKFSWGLARLKYIGTAAFLGLLWSVALMIPEVTRNLILDDRFVLHIALFPIVSIAIAMLFRRTIERGSGGIRFVVLGISLPLLGAALWFLMASFVNWVTEDSAAKIWQLAAVSIALLPVALWTVAYAAYYIVIPMGLLSQYIMNKLARGCANGAEAGQAT